MACVCLCWRLLLCAVYAVYLRVFAGVSVRPQDYPDAQVALGNACVEGGAVAEGVKWYTLAATGPAPHTDALYNLGSIHYDRAKGATAGGVSL